MPRLGSRLAVAAVSIAAVLFSARTAAVAAPGPALLVTEIAPNPAGGDDFEFFEVGEPSRGQARV